MTSLRNRDVLTIIGLSVCAKSLLVCTYVSTDFEVHRNWLAITYNLPIKEWYTENTSQWTLDYPPLFAWFEYILSRFAAFIDPKMLEISNLNYKSPATILFQRFSVIITDLVLAYAAVVWHGILYEDTKRLERLFQPVILVGLILNPGLLIVDHMHFQYNGLLMGIMLLSLARVYKGQVLWGAFWFSVLLNMKHIYLYIAPPFFFYLLSSYVMQESSMPRRTSGDTSHKTPLLRFIELASVVVAVFAVSFGPFIYHDQLPQIVSRLFPVQRGLLHAYWAPNFWAHYAGLDTFLSILMRKLGFEVGSNSLTSGLVQESEFAVIPNVPSFLTIIIVAALMLPSCIRLFRNPTNRGFIRSVIFCGFTSFLFGYHVHEKAVLIPLLCMLPLVVISCEVAAVFEIVAAVGHCSLTPLIFTKEEALIKVAFIVLYHYYIHNAVQAIHRRNLLTRYGRIYLYGLVPLFIYTEWAWKIITPKLEFLPLMAMSTYCAFGLLGSYIKFCFTRSDVVREERRSR